MAGSRGFPVCRAHAATTFVNGNSNTFPSFAAPLRRGEGKETTSPLKFGNESLPNFSEVGSGDVISGCNEKQHLAIARSVTVLPPSRHRHQVLCALAQLKLLTIFAS